jgi:RNA polymerase sigma factor (sigma-70 family)
MGEIRDLFTLGAIGTWTDGQLIGHYLSGEADSENAFRVLIYRHGPMVLRVWRRIIGDEHTAEDAFQATFLVLVKKARTLRDRGLLANWLYGVALKISHKERKRGERRRTAERRAVERTPMPRKHPEADEVRSLVAEEIARLPDRYRMPLWLCHIEGLPHAEAARRLGCPVGTVESRLSRARDRLRQRLVRRGLTSPAMAIAAVPVLPSIDRVRAGLVESTLQAARGAPDVGAASLVARRLMWGREGQAAAGITLGAGVTTAGLAIALGLVAVSWKRADEDDVLPYGPIYSPVSRRCAFIGKTPGKGRALYAFEAGKPGRPRRLESEGSFDNLIQDPIFSPDGRFVVFSSDRKPPHGLADEVPARWPGGV